MKKNILLLFCACALAWTSCTDTVDYTAAGAVEGQGVYFPTSVVTSYEVEGVSGEITLDVNRTYSEEAYEAALNATFSEGGESVFTVPATVAFEAGSNAASVTLSYNNLVRGQEYTVSLSFADSTPYSNSSIQLSVLYPSEVVYEWEVVSEDAVLIDNMFAPYGAKDIPVSELTVEKAKGFNVYRFKSPYDNNYFSYMWGISNIFSGDYEYPYITLDGETYKAYNKYYIPIVNLGFQMVDGEGPKADPDWATFGSVAVNLSVGGEPVAPDSKDYPLGTYDNATKKFDFGTVFHNLGGYGYYPMDGFSLYLDPSLMTPDYNRDYTWVDVEESEGEYISELAGQSVVTVLQQAEEDETFYRIPDLYAQGYPLYFKLDKETGSVTIPTEIPIETGMTVIGGNKVYVKGAAGKSSYNAENGVINLGLVFYLADADGNETVELATSNDIFVWGKSGMDLFVPGLDINEYLGNWGMKVFDSQGEYASVANVSLTENSTNSLSVSGIFGDPDYDDTFILKYNEVTGLLEFGVQAIAPYYNTYDIYMSMGNDQYYTTKESEKLIGGISIIDGNLKFVNAQTNTAQWTYFTYLASQQGVILGYLLNVDFDWTRIESESAAATVARSVEPMIFKPSDIRHSDKELNVELYRPAKSNSSKSGISMKASALQNISNFSLAK